MSLTRFVFLIILVLGLLKLAWALDCIPPTNTHYPIVSHLSRVPLNDEPLGDFNLLAIPLKSAGRLFLVEATVDGQTGNLILDTGASGLVLNKTYFRNYVSYEKPVAGAGVTSSFDKMYRIGVKHIQISTLYYQNLETDVSDLSHIENRRGVKVLGLLGLNLLNDFEIVFDARNQQLQLFRLDKQGNRIGKEDKPMGFDFRTRIDTHNNVIILRGNIADKEFNFCLDTGAETNVIDSHLPKKVMNTVEVTRRSALQGMAAGGKEVLYGQMNEFAIAGKRIDAMQTIITNLSGLSEAYGCTISGMLGYDFWISGIYSINFVKQELRFNLWKGEKK